MNDYSFFSAPQLKRHPLGACLYRRVDIRTPLPVAEVERRIASMVGPRRAFMDYFRRRSTSDLPFEGESLGDRFQFSRRINYRNSFLPQIRARIELDPLGTVVRLRMSVHPFVIAFMLFWLAAASGFSLSFALRAANGERDSLASAAMVLFGIALIVAGFYPEAFKAERILRKALDADA